jgi:hypothetical protein
LHWGAVRDFPGARVPNPRHCRLNSTAGTTPPHMIRRPDRTHMRGDTGTHTALVHATLMRVHIAKAHGRASGHQRQAARGGPEMTKNCGAGSAGRWAGTPTCIGRFLSHTHSGPWAYMRSLIAALSASLSVALVAFSASHSQAGFCQYQYKHCLVRCGVIVRKCVPGCERQLHHCKTAYPNLGELTGTR